VVGLPPPLSAVTAVTQTIENKPTSADPKTLKKDIKSDDEPAALNTSDNKLIFRRLEKCRMSFETNEVVSDANIVRWKKSLTRFQKISGQGGELKNFFFFFFSPPKDNEKMNSWRNFS
jgi:hypothetical protein